MNESSSETTTPGPRSAAPSLIARLLAFLAVLTGGASGGLVGYAVTDLQCTSGCQNLAGLMGVLGAAIAAGGVGIVVALTLRAMAEWRTGQLQQAARDHHPVD
ncbi:MAG: hypothetical protein ISR43_05520 [Acidimicrobiia bacterium]|nr:hypothetical protein [Actinomycetota bacterium]MBL6924849.1 hypothetical protein [Acidimicrobiia bacterium]MBL6926671.1 hypothetical protein [Acidimicrobiia bacterium]